MAFAPVLLFLLGASPQLDEGRALVTQLRFAEARTHLEAARASTTLTLGERREAAGLLAHCYAAEGRIADAEKVYAELLSTDARAPAPSSGPPRLRDAFRRAKERLYPPGFASLTREPAPAGRVAVQLLDPWNSCTRGVVIARRGLDGTFTEEAMPVDALGRGSVGVGDASAWFVEARSASGACASLGSLAEPVLVPVIEEEAVTRAPVVTPRSRVVPWISFGVTVAATAAAATFAGLGAGSMDQARSANFASDLRAAELQARDQFTLAWGFGIGAAVAALTTAVLFIAW